MIFNGVEFDDYTKEDESAWSQVCREHSKKFESKENNILTEVSGTPICGVKGCNKTADFYIDFPEAQK